MFFGSCYGAQKMSVLKNWPWSSLQHHNTQQKKYENCASVLLCSSGPYAVAGPITITIGSAPTKLTCYLTRPLIGTPLGCTTFWDGEKGLLEAPKWILWHFKNESTLMMTSVEISAEIIYQSDGSWCVGLSNTKHVHKNVQSCIGTCSPVLRRWCGSPPPQYLPRSDSVVWPLIHI